VEKLKEMQSSFFIIDITFCLMDI